eukprot:scaffold7768_cov110-Skeletonema_marinoi.AAC.10
MTIEEPHPSWTRCINEEKYLIHHKKNTREMLLTAAARPLAATIGRRAFARSFATVGSQIPNVELHS